MSDIGLIGKKIGMTREFYKTGQSVSVTVLKVEKGRVVQLINKEKRGYNAIQVGFGKVKNSKLSKWRPDVRYKVNRKYCLIPTSWHDITARFSFTITYI